jgi:hypothetical protein
MANLVSPPAVFTLPLSKGSDLVVDFQQVDPANPTAFIDYADGTTVALVIDATPQITAAATISGHDALVRVESEVTDLVPNMTLWRLIVTIAGSPATEIVAVNGTVARFDGR